jgi:tetratricopeptide (TPR) repeat protein
VTHYLIHLYDVPALAARGIPAADRYAAVAPASAHARHMPSHIYTRVGLWNQSIASNLASLEAAKAERSVGEQLHAMDYLVYAYLQVGRDRAARAIIDEISQSAESAPYLLAGHFALASSPARYVVERGDWTAAARLQLRPRAPNQVQAITHFARALGAARSGQPDAAAAEIARLAVLRDRLRQAGEEYWSQQVDIQRQIASAWQLHATGDASGALAAMRTAVELEDQTEKSPITPGPLAPAREFYGAMLLDRGMAQEALDAFEESKVKEPNRFHGYAGAARAAETLGDRARARHNYEQLLILAADGDGNRPELALAQTFMARR